MFSLMITFLASTPPIPNEFGFLTEPLSLQMFLAMRVPLLAVLMPPPKLLEQLFPITMIPSDSSGPLAPGPLTPVPAPKETSMPTELQARMTLFEIVHRRAPGEPRATSMPAKLPEEGVSTPEREQRSTASHDCGILH